MFSAILSAQPVLIFVFLVTSALLVSLGFLIGRKIGYPRRIYWAAAGLGLSIVLSATLTPAKNSSGYSGTCTISKDFLDSVGTEQWSLNLLLFVPMSVAFLLAGASSGSVIVGAAVLSTGIEFAQANIPGVGRACDSDDVIANIAGALIATVTIAVYSLLTGKRQQVRLPESRTKWSRAYLLEVSTGVVVLLVGFSTVTLNIVSSSTPIKEAGANDTQSASNSLEKLFGHRVDITHTQMSRLPNEYKAKITLIISWHDGIAELSLPDHRVHTVDSTAGVPLSGFRGPSQILNEATAKSRAAEFAARDLVSVKDNTKISVEAERNPRSAWRVTYSQEVGGVASPPYFELIFTKDGRLMKLANTTTVQ